MWTCSKLFPVAFIFLQILLTSFRLTLAEGSSSKNSSKKSEKSSANNLVEKTGVLSKNTIFGESDLLAKHLGPESSSNIHAAFQASAHTRRVRDEDLTDELDEWKSPEFLRKNFPYYLSGYDDASGSPIWYAQIGRMDLRNLVDQGGQMLDDFEIYAQQAAYRILKSIRNSSSTDRPVTEALFLLDCDGLSMRQITLPNLVFVIKIAYRYSQLAMAHVGPSVIINANFLAENVIRLVKPAFGSALARVEIYGTKRNKWLPEVRRIFGPDSLPHHYGGVNKDFKPLAVYG